MIKVGDSVRLYETDTYFHGGKVIEILIDEIYVDWGEFRSQYVSSDFEHEFRDGVWSWRPLNMGKII